MNRYFNMKTNLFTVLIFLFTTSLINAATSEADPPIGQFVVVLDAGHGGQDPGNTWNGFVEKDIALNIVMQVGAELEKLPGVKVIYTRKAMFLSPLPVEPI